MFTQDSDRFHNMVLRGDKYVPLGKRLDQLERKINTTTIAVWVLVILHLPVVGEAIPVLQGLAVHTAQFLATAIASR